MHVTPKQIAFAAVAVVLLAVVLFWQGAADGMDQPQLETAAESGSAPARAEKGRDGARYEKIRGMESQVAVEDLRNPFSPGHEKRGEAAAAPVKSAQKKEAARPVQPQPAPTARNADEEGKPPAEPIAPAARQVLALRGIVQGAEPLVILSDGAQSRSLAVGEHFFGYEVVEIGRTGVRLCGPDGEIWLPMASFHSDGEAAGQDDRIETR